MQPKTMGAFTEFQLKKRLTLPPHAVFDVVSLSPHLCNNPFNPPLRRLPQEQNGF